MKIEALKADMKKYPLRSLIDEAVELHKNYDVKNVKQARFNCDLVARALISRRL